MLFLRDRRSYQKSVAVTYCYNMDKWYKIKNLREGSDMLTQEKIKNAVQIIAPKFNIQSVYLFGSYARGDATEDSDCDFRIVGGNIRNLYDKAALHIDLEDILGCSVDIVMTNNIKETFFNAIRDEEILLYAK